MLIRNFTPLQVVAANRINERRTRNVRPIISNLGDTFIHSVYQVNNADLAVFPGKIHNHEHPLIRVGDKITVKRRMTHAYGFIFFFTTADGLEGFIRSDAVSEAA